MSGSTRCSRRRLLGGLARLPVPFEACEHGRFRSCASSSAGGDRRDGLLGAGGARGPRRRHDADHLEPAPSRSARRRDRSGPPLGAALVHGHVGLSTRSALSAVREEAQGAPGPGGAARPCRSRCAPSTTLSSIKTDSPLRPARARRRPPHPRSWRPGSPCRR